MSAQPITIIETLAVPRRTTLRLAVAVYDESFERWPRVVGLLYLEHGRWSELSYEGRITRFAGVRLIWPQPLSDFRRFVR